MLCLSLCLCLCLEWACGCYSIPPPCLPLSFLSLVRVLCIFRHLTLCIISPSTCLVITYFSLIRFSIPFAFLNFLIFFFSLYCSSLHLTPSFPFSLPSLLDPKGDPEYLPLLRDLLASLVILTSPSVYMSIQNGRRFPRPPLHLPPCLPPPPASPRSFSFTACCPLASFSHWFSWAFLTIAFFI